MRHFTPTAPDTRIASAKPAFMGYPCGSVDVRHLTSRPGQHRWLTSRTSTSALGLLSRNSQR